MTQTLTIADLGWSAFYNSQLEIDEIGTVTPARVSSVHRTRIATFTENC